MRTNEFPVLEKPMPLTMRNPPNHVNWENNIMTIILIPHNSWTFSA